MKKIITLSSLILFSILPTLSWGESNRIEGKYLCHPIFGYNNYYDKTELEKESKEKTIKIEIFEDKVISKTMFVQKIKNKDPLIYVDEYLYQRPKHNIGKKIVEGYDIGKNSYFEKDKFVKYEDGHLKKGFRTVNFKDNKLTYVITESPIVWVYSYHCELDY